MTDLSVNPSTSSKKHTKKKPKSKRKKLTNKKSKNTTFIPPLHHLSSCSTTIPSDINTSPSIASNTSKHSASESDSNIIKDHPFNISNTFTSPAHTNNATVNDWNIITPIIQRSISLSLDSNSNNSPPVLESIIDDENMIQIERPSTMKMSKKRKRHPKQSLFPFIPISNKHILSYSTSNIIPKLNIIADQTHEENNSSFARTSVNTNVSSLFLNTVASKTNRKRKQRKSITITPSFHPQQKSANDILHQKKRKKKKKYSQIKSKSKEISIIINRIDNDLSSIISDDIVGIESAIEIIHNFILKCHHSFTKYKLNFVFSSIAKQLLLLDEILISLVKCLGKMKRYQRRSHRNNTILLKKMKKKKKNVNVGNINAHVTFHEQQIKKLKIEMNELLNDMCEIWDIIEYGLKNTKQLFNLFNKNTQLLLFWINLFPDHYMEYNELSWPDFVRSILANKSFQKFQRFSPKAMLQVLSENYEKLSIEAFLNYVQEFESVGGWLNDMHNYIRKEIKHPHKKSAQSLTQNEMRNLMNKPQLKTIALSVNTKNGDGNEEKEQIVQRKKRSRHKHRRKQHPTRKTSIALLSSNSEFQKRLQFVEKQLMNNATNVWNVWWQTIIHPKIKKLQARETHLEESLQMIHSQRAQQISFNINSNVIINDVSISIDNEPSTNNNRTFNDSPRPPLCRPLSHPLSRPLPTDFPSSYLAHIPSPSASTFDKSPNNSTFHFTPSAINASANASLIEVKNESSPSLEDSTCEFVTNEAVEKDCYVIVVECDQGSDINKCKIKNEEQIPSVNIEIERAEWNKNIQQLEATISELKEKNFSLQETLDNNNARMLRLQEQSKKYFSLQTKYDHQQRVTQVIKQRCFGLHTQLSQMLKHVDQWYTSVDFDKIDQQLQMQAFQLKSFITDSNDENVDKQKNILKNMIQNTNKLSKNSELMWNKMQKVLNYNLNEIFSVHQQLGNMDGNQSSDEISIPLTKMASLKIQNRKNKKHKKHNKHYSTINAKSYYAARYGYPTVLSPYPRARDRRAYFASHAISVPGTPKKRRHHPKYSTEELEKLTFSANEFNEEFEEIEFKNSMNNFENNLPRFSKLTQSNLNRKDAFLKNIENGKIISRRKSDTNISHLKKDKVVESPSIINDIVNEYKSDKISEKLEIIPISEIRKCLTVKKVGNIARRHSLCETKNYINHWYRYSTINVEKKPSFFRLMSTVSTDTMKTVNILDTPPTFSPRNTNVFAYSADMQNKYESVSDLELISESETEDTKSVLLMSRQSSEPVPKHDTDTKIVSVKSTSHLRTNTMGGKNTFLDVRMYHTHHSSLCMQDLKNKYYHKQKSKFKAKYKQRFMKHNHNRNVSQPVYNPLFYNRHLINNSYGGFVGSAGTSPQDIHQRLNLLMTNSNGEVDDSMSDAISTLSNIDYQKYINFEIIDDNDNEENLNEEKEIEYFSIAPYAQPMYHRIRQPSEISASGYMDSIALHERSHSFLFPTAGAPLNIDSYYDLPLPDPSEQPPKLTKYELEMKVGLSAKLREMDLMGEGKLDVGDFSTAMALLADDTYDDHEDIIENADDLFEFLEEIGLQDDMGQSKIESIVDVIVFNKELECCANLRDILLTSLMDNSDDESDEESSERDDDGNTDDEGLDDFESHLTPLKVKTKEEMNDGDDKPFQPIYKLHKGYQTLGGGGNVNKNNNLPTPNSVGSMSTTATSAGSCLSEEDDETNYAADI